MLFRAYSNSNTFQKTTLVRHTSEKESGLWPTPNTMEGIKPKPLENIIKVNQKNRAGRSYLSMNLREAVYYGKRTLDGQKFPTPRASEWKGTGPLNSKSHKHRLEKGYLDATIQDLEQATGALNPTWVEWLMGYPLGWTDLKV